MKLGIDVGSTTVKLVFIDDDGQIIYSKYERHMSNVFEKVEELIEEAEMLLGDYRPSESTLERFRIWSGG